MNGQIIKTYECLTPYSVSVSGTTSASTTTSATPTCVSRSLLFPSVSGLKRIVLVLLTLASFHHIFFQAHTHTHIHTSILLTCIHTSCARVLLFTCSFWCRACVWRECSGFPPPTSALDRQPHLALSCLLLPLACMGAEVSVWVR